MYEIDVHARSVYIVVPRRYRYVLVTSATTRIRERTRKRTRSKLCTIGEKKGARPRLSSPLLSRWGNRYRFSSAITTGEPWRAIVTRQHYSRVVVLFITSLTYAEFDEYTTRKFKLVTRVEGAKIGEPVSRFEKTNILSKGISSRETRDTFVSANCIIFNLYPVHAILDTVATPAQLVTPSSS